MIKVIVEKKPIYDFKDLHQDYALNCEYSLDDEATATEALHMFCNALQLEGYMQKSIIDCLRECADNIETEEII